MDFSEREAHLRRRGRRSGRRSVGIHHQAHPSSGDGGFIKADVHVAEAHRGRSYAEGVGVDGEPHGGVRRPHGVGAPAEYGFVYPHFSDKEGQESDVEAGALGADVHSSGHFHAQAREFHLEREVESEGIDVELGLVSGAKCRIDAFAQAVLGPGRVEKHDKSDKQQAPRERYARDGAENSAYDGDSFHVRRIVFPRFSTS